jgi:hypothetical protein
MKAPTILAGLACAALALPSTALAQSSQPAERAAAAAQEAEPIYGRDLMTPNEIAEHRAQMQAAKTAEERERIRAEHHSRMRQRAKERGVEIPETPPRTGQGHGPGPGAGHGGQGAGGPKR